MKTKLILVLLFAISDGQQSLNFDEASILYKNVRTMLKAKRQLN